MHNRPLNDVAFTPLALQNFQADCQILFKRRFF